MGQISMSTLIIGNSANPMVQNLLKKLQSAGEEADVFAEIGRCITPISKESRMRIDMEGQRGQELANRADKVYLVRGEKVERIK